MQTDDKDARTGLSIGVFDKFAALHSALADLNADEFGQDRLCILGLPSVLRAEVPNYRDAEFGQPLLLALLSRLQERALPHSDLEVLATSGPTLDALSALPSVDGGPTRLDFDRLSRFSGSLSGHIASGGVALVIQTTCAAIQDQSTRILLRHATLGVFTHEFLPSAKTRL